MIKQYGNFETFDLVGVPSRCLKKAFALFIYTKVLIDQICQDHFSEHSVRV